MADDQPDDDPADDDLPEGFRPPDGLAGDRPDFDDEDTAISDEVWDRIATARDARDDPGD